MGDGRKERQKRKDTKERQGNAFCVTAGCCIAPIHVRVDNLPIHVRVPQCAHALNN